MTRLILPHYCCHDKDESSSLSVAYTKLHTYCTSSSSRPTRHWPALAQARMAAPYRTALGWITEPLGWAQTLC